MSDAVVIVPSKTADVGRLLKLARQDTRIAVEGESHPPVISAFVTRVRETLNRLVMPTAGLVVRDFADAEICGWFSGGGCASPRSPPPALPVDHGSSLFGILDV